MNKKIILKLDRKEIACEFVDWIFLFRTGLSGTFLITAMKPRLSYKVDVFPRS
jgi:hypothetical protein